MTLIIWITTIFKIGLPVFLAVLNLHQFLYNKNPRYYFFIIKRLKKWRDTKWKINANYSIKSIDEGYKTIENSIKNVFGEFDRIVNLKNKKQYVFGDFSLLVQDNDVLFENSPRIELQFLPINVTYKVAQEKLSELRTFFTDIDDNINSLEKNYHMDVIFNNSNNPFFGLMIQRLGKENLTYFECLFDLNIFKKSHETIIKTKTKNNVRVYKEQITINEKSFATIEVIALDILLMR